MTGNPDGRRGKPGHIAFNFAKMWQGISRYRSDAARFAYGRREYGTAMEFQRGAADAYKRMTFYLDRSKINDGIEDNLRNKET